MRKKTKLSLEILDSPGLELAQRAVGCASRCFPAGSVARCDKGPRGCRWLEGVGRLGLEDWDNDQERGVRPSPSDALKKIMRYCSASVQEQGLYKKLAGWFLKIILVMEIIAKFSQETKVHEHPGNCDAKMTIRNIIQWIQWTSNEYGSPRDQLEHVGNAGHPWQKMEALIAAGVTRVIFECPKRVGELLFSVVPWFPIWSAKWPTKFQSFFILFLV